MFRYSPLELLQSKFLVKSPDRRGRVFFVDDAGDAHFRRTDEIDVDFFCREGSKHTSRNPRRTGDTGTHNGNLRQFLMVDDVTSLQTFLLLAGS